jgi:hypothetical protein
MAMMAAAAAAAIAAGRTTTEGCVCKVCGAPSSPRTPKTTGICLRIEAQRVWSARYRPPRGMPLPRPPIACHVIPSFLDLYGIK